MTTPAKTPYTVEYHNVPQDWTGTLGARFIRVSSDNGQDETAQLPEIDRYGNANGIFYAATYRLHDISASKGEQEPAYESVVKDITAGKFTTVVVRDRSRWDRRNLKRAYNLTIAAVSVAGGHVLEARSGDVLGPVAVSRDDEEFTDQEATIAGFLQAFKQAPHAEFIKKLTGDIKDGQAKKRDAGSLFWTPPLGYVKVPRNGDVKHPDLYIWTVDETRAPIVREVFRRVDAGESGRAVERGLGLAGGRVSEIIRDPTYAGSPYWTDRSSGRAVRKPYVPAEPVPPLVTDELWASANAAMDGRTSAVQPTRHAAPLLTRVCTCALCGGTVYGKPSKSRDTRYTCANGCFNTTGRLLEGVVSAAFGELDRKIQVRRIVRGSDDVTRRIAALEKEERTLPNSGLPRRERNARLAEIAEEIERLEGMSDIPDTEVWEESDETYAQRWASLTDAERNEWLRTSGVRVYIAKESDVLQAVSSGHYERGPNTVTRKAGSKSRAVRVVIAFGQMLR